MSAEETVSGAVGVLVTVVEACGASVIGVGALWAFLRLIIVSSQSRRTEDIIPVRIGLGRALTIGLEFQLAADVLRSAVAPSFRDIGQLAAIAAIRTVLNYFLNREIKEERRQVAEDRGKSDTSPPSRNGPTLS
ncbi:DUF1622 domain-containing protein [Streptomyces sp. NBC_01497]|uniref:DUF1622 domain-containing protein n=1 Tax=Streptomyces sp. NBC_01497 TaxID=2903885 RepID=UPI002E33CAB4|nr:DUF1622 domain-containing protein [Streptomyces sp. NBC_01497]